MSLSRVQWICGWFTAIAVAIVGGLAIGVTMALSTGALLLAASLVPPTVMLIVWRDAPATVAQVLHATETTGRR